MAHKLASERAMQVRIGSALAEVKGMVARSPLSPILLRNATPSIFHQRHIGRVLRSSCNSRG
jgi:hypothetical protein